MSHTTRHIVTRVNNIEALLNLASAMADTFPADADDGLRAQNGIHCARETLISYDSPFLTHRKAVLARPELQRLVMFLFGGDRLSFFHLFGSLATAEVDIALECIASYATNGERDDDFMRLAAEILDLQKAAA